MAEEKEDEFRTFVSKAVEKKLAFIDHHKEELLEAWVAQYGWMPSECVLVQQQDGMNVKIWIERKPQEQIDREQFIYTCKWKLRGNRNGVEFQECEEDFEVEAKAYAKGSNIASSAKELKCTADITITKRLR